MRRALPFLIALFAALVIVAPVAAQSGPSEQREAAEEALADVQRLTDGRGIRTGRELSVALLELATRRSDLSRADRQEANELLARPTTPGFTGTGGPYGDSARVMRNCSANFCVHWVDSTADAPPLSDLDACPTPDYVDHARRALEQSYAVENGQLAWSPPVSDGTTGGNDKTDVYLKELNADTSAGSLYGYAATDDGQGGRSRSAFMVFDDDFAADEFGYDNYEVPVEVTAAHEYNHVLQYAYDVLQDPWMYESTATWAEEKVFPDDDDYHAYMDTWAGLPEEPLTSAETSKIYGSAIWNHWLEQRYGADVVRRAWELSVANGDFAPAAYDAAIKVEAPASSFAQNFAHFAAATAEWDATSSGVHEGAEFPFDVARSPSLLAVDGNVGAATVDLEDLDNTSYQLFPVKIPDSTAPLTLSGTISNDTIGSIALVGIDAIDGSVTKVVAPFAAGSATVTMPENPRRFSRITAALVNADTRKTGVRPNWIWLRNNQTGSLTLTQAPRAADVPVPEDPDPDITGVAPDAACGTTTIEREPAVTPTPTPSVTPSPTPTVTPTPTPRPATSVRLSRNSTRIGSVARKGVLSLFARTNKAGRLTARATVDTATAKRLKVGRRTTTAGSGRRTATAPARVKINVKLSRKVRAALKREKRRTLRIKVRVTFVPADGTAAVRRTLSVLLRP